MHIKKIGIKNFRLLEDVTLVLEEQTTLIVGRNNSGKTSLTELFRRLLSGKSPSFNLEDFSLSVHECFWTAFKLNQENLEESNIRSALPAIEVKLSIKYNHDDDLGLLSDFIVDLNPDCSEALIVVRYQLKDGEIASFFENTGDINQEKKAFFEAIHERVSNYYVASAIAVDPNDPENNRPIEWSALQLLLNGGFINAQRGLDDITSKDRDVLGKVLENLLSTAMLDFADPKDRNVAKKLEEAVKNIQSEIDKGFNVQLKELLPAFSLFGYPGLSDPNLITETKLDVERLLTGHTKVRYVGVNGINLPEAYNGLGVRNLIFILLKLLELYKSFMAKPTASSVHLIFIEEPEVHLHPQMQEVFIRKLGEIAGAFTVNANNGRFWPVQFIVTTHSSHIANEAPLQSIRYFLSEIKETKGVYASRIKDLREGLSGGATAQDMNFLHKYMTLTRCDLMFADKAVLIEGATERLLLPKMIEKVDEAQGDNQKLASQYVSVIEVGGAYAHLFFRLLNFLELRTLIITDLDAVNIDRKSCKVSDGNLTSNACLKNWFNNNEIAPSDLIGRSEADKIKDIIRIAYQVPEGESGPCGRSFEDAFMLANTPLFKIEGNSDAEKEADAWNKAISEKEKKTEFALKYAIKESEWVVPRYIEEGLIWLAATGNRS